MCVNVYVCECIVYMYVLSSFKNPRPAAKEGQEQGLEEKPGNEARKKKGTGGEAHGFWFPNDPSLCGSPANTFSESGVRSSCTVSSYSRDTATC